MPVVFNDFEKKWETKCGSCGTLNPSSWGSSTARAEDGSYAEWCGECSVASFAGVPDVFWDGKPEENLADGPDGKPRVFVSKGQKARYLQERGIYEAGDRFHGAPFTGLVPGDRAAKAREFQHSAAEARRKVEGMGRDVKRQEILRIIKESSR